MNKQQVLGKPKVMGAPTNQILSQRGPATTDDSDDVGIYNKQAPPTAQVFIAKVTTMNYNNQVGGTSQVTKQAAPNSVMAGFVMEEQLIQDSENQRNIDLSELKDLLN